MLIPVKRAFFVQGFAPASYPALRVGKKQGPDDGGGRPAQTVRPLEVFRVFSREQEGRIYPVYGIFGKVYFPIFPQILFQAVREVSRVDLCYVEFNDPLFPFFPCPVRGSTLYCEFDQLPDDPLLFMNS